MANKYEFRLVTLTRGEEQDGKLLNEMGQDGWYIVAALPNSEDSYERLYMEREIAPDTAEMDGRAHRLISLMVQVARCAQKARAGGDLYIATVPGDLMRQIDQELGL